MTDIMQITKVYEHYGLMARKAFGLAPNHVPALKVMPIPQTWARTLAQACFDEFNLTDPISVEIDYRAIPLMDDDELEYVIAHEVAHVAAGFFAGHGEEWAAACSLLGVPAYQFFHIRRNAEFCRAIGFPMSRYELENDTPTLGAR